MPSKGVKCFAYIAAPDTSVEFSVPNKSITKTDQKSYTCDHLEVESSNLPRFKFTGRFEFKVRRGGREVNCQWVDINSLTGSLENGTMKDMEQTPSILVEDLKAFNKVVLPAAHDIGMNNLTTATAMLRKAGTSIIKEVLGRSLPNAFDIMNKVSDSAINHIAPDIIRALAITQKDSLETILKIGARYFEFRPAKCHRQMQRVSPLEDTWYFQHGAIPGMPYEEFLHKIVKFLDEHKDEIVVVQNRWDGVPGDCPRPNADELRKVLDELVKDKDINVGSQDDMMQKSIRDLRNEKKRLIVLQNANQVSNYDDAANATLNGDSMVTKLNDMAKCPPKGHSITLLQCQATATNIRDVIIASIMDSDVSTSPILATKAICDAKILPLLRGECGRSLTWEESVVVLLNDFFDGATADVAIELCRERLK
ncbi:hypothetical protein N0V90_007391 [Kalmusia sp. IMI 367209]|nr:hypothetical protein N0V90_007391 [Kalmusia sp. IMI 367209]